MKLTVNKYLNARIGEPSTNASCQVYKNPGDTLEIDDVVIGTEIDGNSIWYHCKDDGCFYWSGGVSDITFEILNLNIDEKLLYAIIRDIQNNYYIAYSKIIDGYRGCGIGYKNFDSQNMLCLIFFVNSKKELKDVQRPVPEFIIHKGIKVYTDVKEIKPPGFQTFSPTPINPDPDNFFPLNMGGKIYRQNHPDQYGTRTIKISKNNKTYILSCCHVMALDSIKFPFQSANLEHLHIKISIPDQFTQTVHLLEVIEGGFNGFIDYALAEIENTQLMQNFFNGRLISDLAEEGDVNLLWHHTVESIGRTSGLQSGIILTTSTKVDIKDKTFHDIIITERLSTGGDSGAPVVKDNLLIGYVFGGDDDQFSFIMPIYKLKGISI